MIVRERYLFSEWLLEVAHVAVKSITKPFVTLEVARLKAVTKCDAPRSSR